MLYAEIFIGVDYIDPHGWNTETGCQRGDGMGRSDVHIAATPAVSVVMPVCNGAATIGQQLEGLAGQTYQGPWELVIADNGSRDETVVITRRWTNRIRRLSIVDAADRPGVSYARNVGCRNTDGEFLLFCDADDVVDSGWIAAMVASLQHHPIAGGRIDRTLLNDPVSTAARPGTTNSLLNSFGFLPYPLTANCGMRKEIWVELGGFDERYHYGSDDVAFFWRAQLAGYEVDFVPEAIVHYRLRSKIPDMAHQYYTYGKTHTMLYRDFATAGMPRLTITELCREWGWLIQHAPDLCGSRAHRAVLLTRLAMRIGRIVGSIQNRVIYL
jgi:glycosyltransferase involved in cell wall biosynthesis